MTIAANLAARTARHDFISTEPGVGGDRSSLGYPDECRDLTLFADSLAALVTDNAWMIQPFTQKMQLIAVDFASETQEEAEASLVHGWNGAWETPMGAVTTVKSRHETNEQNALIERHLTLFATGFTMRDFYWFVIEKLLDSHSCVDTDCEVCAGRFKRTLADVFTLFADGMGEIEITLFSKWVPNADLSGMLAREGIVLRHRPLSDIPAEDLEANRYYTIWSGPEARCQDFLRRFWSPSWKLSATGA